MVVTQEFLDQQFSDALHGILSAYDPYAINGSDKTQFVSLLSKSGDKTSGRRVWSRQVTPQGAVTNWVEVRREYLPWQ